jgi:hypothetical protein
MTSHLAEINFNIYENILLSNPHLLYLGMYAKRKEFLYIETTQGTRNSWTKDPSLISLDHEFGPRALGWMSSMACPHAHFALDIGLTP